MAALQVAGKQRHRMSCSHGPARLRQVKLLQLIVMEDAVEEGTLDMTAGGDSADQELHFRG